MNKQRKLPSLGFLLIAGTFLLLLVMQLAGLLPDTITPTERVDLLARDAMLRMRGTRQPADDIVIVAIDDLSLNYVEYSWPWPRTYLAEIVDWLNQAGAQVIELDLYLFNPDPDPDGDISLSRALGETPASVSNLQIFRPYEGQDYVTLKTTSKRSLEGFGRGRNCRCCTITGCNCQGN